VNSKERMMLALNREKPDRLPATVHQWQGYHLDTYMGGISDLAAFQQVGLDAQIQYFQDMGQFWLVDADMSKLNTATWRDEITTISSDPDNRIAHHTIFTPEGTLSYKTAGDRKTTWITEYLIKHDEDIELIRKYMPVPALDPASRSYIIKIDLRAPDTSTFFRSGIFGKARFNTGTKQVLTVPVQSVLERGQLTFVYVVDPAKIAHMRLIQTGKTYGDRVEVLSGLSEGDLVILEPLSAVKDGAAVEPGEPS